MALTVVELIISLAIPDFIHSIKSIKVDSFLYDQTIPKQMPEPTFIEMEKI